MAVRRRASAVAVHGGRVPKRARVTAEPSLLEMRAFPGRNKEEEPARGGGQSSFRARVRGFLARCAVAAAPTEMDELSPGMSSWHVGFTTAEAVAVMEVVEEEVARSRRVYCEHCTVAGWSKHPVCSKRYHFIIRNENEIGTSKTCRRCGFMVALQETRCPSCNHVGLSRDDPEDWDYVQLESPRHLLHGIVHENGFGHLVRINGREGGSSVMTGSQLMNFWDQLCRYLRVRKVSVMDVSKKYGSDYRSLHAVATGCSWYGLWGFKLSSGSFGITPLDYSKAVESLSSVPLSNFFPHSRSPRNQLQNTIAFYQSLSRHPLTTIRELFACIIELATGKSVHKEKMAYDAHYQEEFPEEELQRATDIALKILRAADRWVATRTLKAVTSHPIGSPQLVDYCIKTLGGTRTDDGMVVAVRCNSEMNTVEYRLTTETLFPPNNVCTLTQDHLFRDIKFLYDALLYPYTMHPYMPEENYEHAKRSAMILLDCKQFIKHYDLEEDFLPQNPSQLHIWCQVKLADQVDDPPCIPAELITLPQTATIADLKGEAARAFRDMYLMLQSFIADQLLDCATASETTQIKLLFGAKGAVRIKGRCIGGERRFAIYRMERGVDKWTVKCSCGAKDDDGERMLSCDSCHMWMHTRCAGISDFDRVPKRYVCKSCKLTHKPKSSGPRLMYSSAPYKRCKTGTGSFSNAAEGLLRPHIS
uniref:PHD-type domain-containing protein n=1 Tax=Oryza punctata TaxID=4537 RepID=A0A0E0ME41_ORYPU